MNSVEELWKTFSLFYHKNIREIQTSSEKMVNNPLPSPPPHKKKYNDKHHEQSSISVPGNSEKFVRKIIKKKFLLSLKSLFKYVLFLFWR